MSAQQVGRELASRRTTTALLNCYLREYAEPRGLTRSTAAGLEFDFPRLRKTCHQVAPESDPVLDGRCVDWHNLARMVIGELSAAYGQPYNYELLTQVNESHARMSHFFAHPPRDVDDPFLASEQSLASGHSYHPAPKARPDSLLCYSPELGREFPLFYFEVRPEHLLFRTNGPEDIPDLLSKLSGGGAPVLAIHPWQAEHLLGTEPVQREIREGRLKPLGVGGVPFAATSSVRTLYSRSVPWFFKGSLNVRLTNCVRKNAWYELETALLLDRWLSELPHPFGEAFTLLREPAYTTVDLPSVPLREGFSTIYRDSRPILEARQPVYMSAALFGGTHHRALLQRMRPGLDWFASYCRLLVWPALWFYAEHGAVFEPHLQNTLVRCREGVPDHVYFRDLEGTKLLPERWEQRVPVELRGAVLYDEDRAWCRFVYCLVFNQLAEVVDSLGEIPCQELWREVRRSLSEYLVAHGTASSRAIVERLQGDRLLPVKANLITRFLQARDRDAAYVWVTNPLS